MEEVSLLVLQDGDSVVGTGVSGALVHEDDGVPLHDGDVSLQLAQLLLQRLLAAHLGDGVREHGQPLEDGLQLLPVLLQPLQVMEKYNG